jgi:SNF2 family DNA or RNA helicase
MILLPQQKIMRDYLLEHPVAGLFVDMGLGKTGATLSVIDHLLADGQTKGALVVAPLRVTLLTWPNEIRKWFPHLRIADLRTEKGQDAWRRGTANVYLINYEMLPWFAEFVKKKTLFPVDIVVWDELSKAKSANSKRIRAIRPLRENFKRHWGLSGSLISNGYLDLFAPMRLLDGGERLGKNVTAYKERYFDSDFMGWKWTLKPWAKDAIHRKIADITLVLKASDYLSIPPTITNDIEIELPPEIFKQYKKLEKDSLLKLKETEIVGINAAALVGKLLQFSSGAIYDEDKTVNVIHDLKVKALGDLWKKLDRPLLVATQFIHERDRLIAAFGYKGAETFTGLNLDAWNRGAIKMLIADPRSIGHGLNAQDGGCDLVWFTPTWSRELYDQMVARLARLGQTRQTTVHRLLCSRTADWAVIEALRFKGSEIDGLREALENLQTLATAA